MTKLWINVSRNIVVDMDSFDGFAYLLLVTPIVFSVFVVCINFGLNRAFLFKGPIRTFLAISFLCLMLIDLWGIVYWVLFAERPVILFFVPLGVILLLFLTCFDAYTIPKVPYDESVKLIKYYYRLVYISLGLLLYFEIVILVVGIINSVRIFKHSELVRKEKINSCLEILRKRDKSVMYKRRQVVKLEGEVIEAQEELNKLKKHLATN